MNGVNGSMKGMGRFYGGQMGIDCQPGYYEASLFGFNTGQCVPTSETLLQQAQAGVVGSVASGIATSPGTQAALTSAAGAKIGTGILSFYKSKPLLAYGLTVAGIALIIYGAMTFMKPSKAS